MRKITTLRMLVGGALAVAFLLTSAPANAATATAAPARTAVTAAGGARPAAATCNFSTNTSQGFSFNGVFFRGFGYAGHYGGLTVVPSTTQVTSSGIEAQCLLARYGDYNPGTIDGVFGRNSQAAMHRFQTDMNNLFGAGLATGPGQDLPGPASWKWLRWFEQ